MPGVSCDGDGMPVYLTILAVLDLILGILLYVTIRQIQTITTAMDAIDKMACDAKAMADSNSRKINDCYTGIQQIKQMGDELQEFKAAQTKRDINIGKLYIDLYGDIELCKRDNATTYELAAECRNELARMHMAERKVTAD